ncbi:phosphoribosylamine--glycine ligase [Rhodococcus sp. 14-2470-1a]|nr:phosphoribosylamine--glycine ligase [Rhodococcus sp. 14-2470-1a]
MDAAGVALLISALSLVLAGLSLGWQIAQWLLSAGRPKASLMHGLSDGAQAWVGPVRKDGTGFDMSRLRQQGVTGSPVVGVQVTNHGRAPVVVETVAMLPRGGSARLVPIGERIGPDLPLTLQPGANASWYLSAEHAERLVRSSREVLHERVSGVYMTAQLATGKTVETPRTLRVP